MLSGEGSCNKLGWMYGAIEPCVALGVKKKVSRAESGMFLWSPFAGTRSEETYERELSSNKLGVDSKKRNADTRFLPRAGGGPFSSARKSYPGGLNVFVVGKDFA